MADVKASSPAEQPEPDQSILKIRVLISKLMADTAMLTEHLGLTVSDVAASVSPEAANPDLQLFDDLFSCARELAHQLKVPHTVEWVKNPRGDSYTIVAPPPATGATPTGEPTVATVTAQLTCLRDTIHQIAIKAQIE